MAYLKVLSVVSLLGAMAWVITDPSFESVLVAIGSASGLLGLFVVERRRKASSNQEQAVFNNSIGIQAGGDVNIGKTKRNRDD
mgnify:CR=1 FL=1